MLGIIQSAFQEGEQAVWWSIAPWSGVGWSGAGEGSFFDAHVRMEVDPDGRLEILVAQPQRDDRYFYSGA